MAVDLLTWVCEKLTGNAPHAANGLADFVADRVLRRFVVLTELESMMEADPEDVRLIIREVYCFNSRHVGKSWTFRRPARQHPAIWGSLSACLPAVGPRG